jgi:hypothetical protein
VIDGELPEGALEKGVEATIPRVSAPGSVSAAREHHGGAGHAGELRGVRGLGEDHRLCGLGAARDGASGVAKAVELREVGLEKGSADQGRGFGTTLAATEAIGDHRDEVSIRTPRDPYAILL